MVESVVHGAVRGTASFSLSLDDVEAKFQHRLNVLDGKALDIRSAYGTAAFMHEGAQATYRRVEAYERKAEESGVVLRLANRFMAAAYRLSADQMMQQGKAYAQEEGISWPPREVLARQELGRERTETALGQIAQLRKAGVRSIELDSEGDKESLSVLAARVQRESNRCDVPVETYAKPASQPSFLVA